MISLKTQAQRQIDEANAQLVQTRTALCKILEQQFGEVPDEDATFNELFARLDRRLQMFSSDKKILSDAIKLRCDLKLPPTTTLSESYTTEVQAKNNAEKKTERIQNEKRQVEVELANLKRGIEKIQTEAKQANEWDHWGRSLFKQVNESSSAAEISPGELTLHSVFNVLSFAQRIQGSGATLVSGQYSPRKDQTFFK